MEISSGYIVIFSIVVLYTLLIIIYAIGWILTPQHKTRCSKFKNIYVSVVIAFRNEEDTIGELLDILNNQSYPKNLFEVVLVNDHSDDKSVDIINRFLSSCKRLKIRLLDLEPNATSKKEALKLGVKNAKGKLIITTDADCRMTSNWIKGIVSFYLIRKAQLIVSPVKFEVKSGFFAGLQEVELAGLIGSTGGSLFYKLPLMCNGANLAFERAFYVEAEKSTVGGGYASGDDIFLLLAAKKMKGAKIAFCKNKDVIVETNPKKSLASFINQRKRWVSKGKGYRDAWIIFNSIVVFLTSISLLLLSGLAFFYPFLTKCFLLSIGLKLLADYFLIYYVLKWFKSSKSMLYFPVAQLLNIPYVVFIAIYGSIGKYNWKGRKVR